jgi:periplasmic divalent cation tolerance protein
LLPAAGFVQAQGHMQPAKEFSLVLVTAPNLTVARRISTAALKEHLVACANLLPKVESHYWWQGQLESASEVLILFKTTDRKLKELEQCVLKNHTYDTPEFVVLSLESGNAKYLDWIRGNIEGK